MASTQTTPASVPPFAAPGPGTWEYDSAHFTRPMAPLLAEVFERSFPEGMRRGLEEYGMVLDTIDCRVVNGFPYMQPRPVGAAPGAKAPPRWLMRWLLPALVRIHPELRRRRAIATGLFERRPWREVVKDWDERLRDETIAAHAAIANVDVATLDDAALADHLERVRDHGVRLLTQDHAMNMSLMLPVGDFLAQAREWTGLEDAELLLALRGSSAVSAGDSRERRQLVEALRQDAKARAVLESSVAPGEILERLTQWPGAVGEAMRAYRMIAGNTIPVGIELESPCADEDPGPLLRALGRVVGGEVPASSGEDADALERIRRKVPEPQRESFDALVEDARLTYRLRDERHGYGAAPVLGIARKACLAIAERLVSDGRLERRSDVFIADVKTLAALLLREPVEVDWEFLRAIHSQDPASVPHRLGPVPDEPPDADWLPGDMARAMHALNAYIRAADGAQPEAPCDEVSGLAVSGGVCEGTARLCFSVEDLDRIRSGDVLVAPLTTSMINVVLPILGAIVTDRGGALSHAAIVSREFGIPGVVGTGDATRRITDGARVRVDGDRGVVELL